MTNFHIPVLLSLFTPLVSQAQTTTPPTTSNGTYTNDQCSYWLFTAHSSDLDESGGLSEDEYYTFLTSIRDPSYVQDYFAEYLDFSSLPWEYRVIYKTMACNCMRMGQGGECCIGQDAEVILSVNGLISSTRQSIVNEEYDKLLCQQIGFLLGQVEVTLEIPLPADTLPPTPAPQTIDAEIKDEVDEVTVPQEIENQNSGLGAGAIVGILFAVFVPLCAGCFILARQRKREEERRLREFAGEAANQDHLASFDAMSAKMEPLPDASEIENLKVEGDAEIVVQIPPEPKPPVIPVDKDKFIEWSVIAEEPEIVVEIPPERVHEEPVKEKDANKKNDKSDDDDSVWSDGDEKDEGEKEIIVEDHQEQKQTVGSALAAMGVASTVATSIISPTSKKDDAETKVNALV